MSLIKTGSFFKKGPIFNGLHFGMLLSIDRIYGCILLVKLRHIEIIKIFFNYISATKIFYSMIGLVYI